MSGRTSCSMKMESLVEELNNLSWSLNPRVYCNIITQIIELFKDGGKDEIVSEAAEDLKAWENTELTIAVTGETGAGKSSIINAFRGLKPKDEGAAPTGATETTHKPDAYVHPNFPNVTFWDLPGVGSAKFPPETYLKQVNFPVYDFFIIVSSKRFRLSDVCLAQEIQKMGKKFYFLRSKVDEDLRNMERTDPGSYSEEQSLNEIRDDCRRNLEIHLGASSPQIFLTSSWDLDKYDFPRLLKTLEKDLPRLKRLAFLLSLPNISPEVIQKKKDALKGLLWKISLVSAFINPIPFEAGLHCDVLLVRTTVAGFYKKFGLDDVSLARLARQSKKSVEKLKAVIQLPPEKDFTRNVFIEQFFSKGGMILSLFFSGAGIIVVGVISFIATYWTLSKSLDTAAEDALRVRKEVLE